MALEPDVHAQLQAQIDRELAAWNDAQRKQSMRYRAAKEAATTLEADFHLEQKHLLAIGDSWFDYPIEGNNPLSGPSDVKVQLQAICSPSPIIYSTAHRGDASTDEMSLPKQERILQLLIDKSNWPNGKPDAIIVSAGGNDVAGNNFCIFLDYNDGTAIGLNAQRFAGVLAIIKSSYLALFSLRDRHAPGVPIYAHCYDFPTLNGVGAPCGYGPWLKPSLDFCNWPAGPGKVIVHDALVQFKAVLDGLAADQANKFHVVPTQGTLNGAHWANELHPDPTGFKMIAQKFATALAMAQLSPEAALELVSASADVAKVAATAKSKSHKGKAKAAGGR
ncbi:SGNH/GDSL hydrolase family protein [Mesorhizobium dulcispinae]|uniref:SGNH/GDSL hydrolase family protein n=1 Tax=Mesorhizobium dulcispinae TaxID=3072316 RepID=UPI002A24EF6E|nr:SGNH/GDSL hydrolase family protein [Mesorhizobium sp. VK23D]MDX8522073.1 SGNH/GDSL hydrolase family protein [Mesorhizobium sp. VK23D]